MEVIETQRHREARVEDLERFLEACRDAAEEDGHWKVASISLRVNHADPLAVLEAIYEPGEFHAYLEHPQAGEAIAGAEAVCSDSWAGPHRFAEARAFADEVLEHTIAVGDLDTPGAGPHFLGAFPFFDETHAGGETAFPRAVLFLPHWQVRQTQGRYVAVANCRVEPDADTALLARRIWEAHQRFTSFRYGEEPPPPPPRLRQREEVGGEGHYCRQVAAALERLRAGTYEKIVLARALDLTFDRDLRPLETANRLRNRFPSCHAFSFANAHGQSLIGATPERLLETDGRRLGTEAIAGSAPRGTSAREDARFASDLLASEKDLREHAHVVESIRRRLASVGITLPDPPPPRLLALPNVQHLHTPLEAELPEAAHLLAVADALHPTPAVGGTPREAALPDILRLEAFPRGLYAGLVGWFDHRGAGEWVVAIRSALIEGPHARLFAGAGLVEGSQPDSEERETRLKMQALLDAITDGVNP